MRVSCILRTTGIYTFSQHAYFSEPTENKPVYESPCVQNDMTKEAQRGSDIKYA